MLFDKSTEPRCAYCAYYRAVGEERGFCEKKGPVPPYENCRAFRYDPIKRVPPRPLPEEELPVFFDPEADEEISPREKTGVRDESAGSSQEAKS